MNGLFQNRTLQRLIRASADFPHSFPLTPALSRGERESSSAATRLTGALGFDPRWMQNSLSRRERVKGEGESDSHSPGGVLSA
jgi:hypothetical protein